MTKQAKTPAVTDTDEQGQPIGGQAAEPPVEALADVDATAVAAEPVDKATLEQQRAEKVKSKRFKDTGRDAIAANLNRQRATEQTAFREQNPEQAELGDQIAGAPSADYIARMEAEARGEADPAEAKQTAVTPRAAAAAPPQEKLPLPLASTPKSYTIRVYGKDDVYTEDQLVAEFQKLKAAGVTLQDAATYEAQVEQWRKDVESWAQEQARKYAAQDGARAQPTGGTANPQPPASGAAGQEIKDLRKRAAEALLRGDDATYSDLTAQADSKLQDSIVAAIAQRAQPETRSSEQVAAPEAPTRTRRAAWSSDDARKINDVFNRDFGDLDDDAFAAAQGMMNARMSNPVNLGKTPEQLVQEVGVAVRRLQTPAPSPTPTPATQPSAVATELEARRTLKAQIPITAPAGSGRAPAAPQAPRFPSNSEYIQNLRGRSGSNSTR